MGTQVAYTYDEILNGEGENEGWKVTAILTAVYDVVCEDCP